MLRDPLAKAPKGLEQVPMEGSQPPVEQQQARDDANGQDLAAIQLVEPRATLDNAARRRDGSWRVILDREATDPQQRARVVTQDEVLAACRAETPPERDLRRVAAKRFTTAIMIRRSAWTTPPAPAARRARTARPRARQAHTARRSNRSNGPPSDAESDSSGDDDPDSLRDDRVEHRDTQHYTSRPRTTNGELVRVQALLLPILERMARGAES